jgi:hypothetical protein
MKTLIVVLLLVVVLFSAACGGPSKDPVNQPLANTGPRPAWVDKEPPNDGQTMTFVGISPPTATESQARDEAMTHASRQVVQYMGEMVKTKYERVRVSFGLSSAVEDPTTSMQAFDKKLAANMVEKLRAREWYTTMVPTHTGPGWKVYVLSAIPNSSIDETYKDTANQMAAEAQEKAKQTSDTRARQQLEDASDFWKKIAEQGLMNE